MAVDANRPEGEGTKFSARAWAGRSGAGERALERVRLYAPLDRPIVLVGPVGSGKSTLAREAHRLSRRPGAFVSVSAGELQGELAHDILFGHEVGAFTGAVSQRKGAIERAARGTLLLDDIAYLVPGVQVALLRVLEDRRYASIGSSSDRASTARLVVGATQDLEELLASGELLPDLRSRLGDLVVRVPALAERREEIPELAIAVAERALAELGRPAQVRLAADCLELLVRYAWPHNLRELGSVMERAALHAGLSAGTVTIRAVHLPERLHRAPDAPPEDGRRKPSLAKILDTLADVDGNQTEAARRLEVHRNTIRRRLARGR